MTSKIGPYQILDVLHSGNRPLFRVQAADGRILALKAIAVAGLSNEMRERFTREGEICRTLDHPNLVRVYDTGEADGNLYQVMDLLTGSDLNTVLASGRSFTWREKLNIMEQVCAGLEDAHARNLVHRDIKPANLFLEDSGRVRVLDFGMARVAASELTRMGSTLGTLNYMSPEQIRGQRCTPASDVFSAGIVFFQLASGRHPFSSRERSLPQVVSAIVFEAPPRLSEICPEAPEGVEFLLNRALEKDPEKRPQDGTALKNSVSLCRITLDMATAPMAPRPDPLPPPVPASKIQAPKPAEPVVSPEGEKTKILRRDEFVHNRPVKPSVPVAPPVVPAPKPVALTTPRFRYCPSCTFANPLHAPMCAGCGIPLTNSPEPGPVENRQSWGLYLAIAVAALLAIALVVVLIVKR